MTTNTQTTLTLKAAEFVDEAKEVLNAGKI